MNFEPVATVINEKVYQLMPATQADVPSLLNLEKAVYHGKTPWSGQTFYSELKKHNRIYLVVYHESTLVGMIGARFHPRETHITNLAVNPAYQGQKIGTWLLKVVIELAKQNASELVSLEVNINNTVAKKLYQSLGFESTFIRKNYYRDTHTDAINMILWLEKGKKEV